MINRIWVYIFAGISMSMAGTLSGQEALDELVNRDYEDEPLSYMLYNLSQRYTVDIRYNETLLPSERFTYSFKEIPIRDVLSILLNDKGLHYKEYKPGKVIVVPAEMVDVDSVLTMTSNILDTTYLPKLELGSTTASSKQTTILGNIIDARNFGPINSALVINNTTGSYLTSNDQGSFSLSIDTGKYVFQITSISHEPYTVSVDIKGSDTWEILLEPKAYLIDEVVITGTSAQQKAKETIIGVEQISRKEIKQLALFMGEADVVKSLLSLAGVTTTGDGASGFNVRGGSIDQNLILQDGTVIFNPSHVLGFFSTFNPDIVRNTTLNKGHIPANYGGRVSSVLDIKIKDGSTELFKGGGSFGLISSKASFEIPIFSGKGSFLTSGRTSYAKWLLQTVKNADVRNSEADFYDFNLKYTHNFSDKTKASLSYFQSFDEFIFAEDFGYSWKNQIGQLELKHIVNDKLSLSWMSSRSSLSNSQFQPRGTFAFDLNSGVDYIQHSAGILWSPGKHVFRTGIEFIDYDIKPEVLLPINDSNTASEEVYKERGQEVSVYINDAYDITENLAVDLGLRFTNYRQLGPYAANLYNTETNLSLDEIIGQEIFGDGEVVSYSGLEPRIAVRYNLKENFAIKASYNRLYQYLQLLSNTATPTPVDIWQVSTPYIKPLSTNSYSAGIAHNFGSIDYNIDVYFKTLQNTLDYRDFAKLLLNSNLETETLSGRGRNYGAEISIAKKGEKFSGRFSYSYSKSEHQIYEKQNVTINQGAWFPSNFDQPHSVKLFLNIQVSRRDRFNINFVYNTGRPITAPIGNYIVGGVVVSNFSNRNAFRLPAYHRLDVGYTFRVNRRSSARYQSELTLSFYNFYARKNAFSIFYRQETGSIVNALKLSVVGTIIPSISYNFSF